MWGDLEVVNFLKHEDWYEQIENLGYVPTRKTPKDKLYILEKLNSKLT